MAHQHSHNTKDYNRAFAIGVTLNLIFVFVEGGFGVFADSVALIADAGHNLSDVLSLLLAWGATILAGQGTSRLRTYGLQKITIMASLASAVLLCVTLGGIAWEAFGRLQNPQPVAGTTMILVSGVGVVVNTLTALLFMSGQKHDLNLRGAFLHMASDAGISLGVVVSGCLILVTGWALIDPLVSLLIVLVVLYGTWGLLRDSLNLAVDSVPRHIDIDGIIAYFDSLEDVARFHDLHVWPLSTTEVALTVHLSVTSPELRPGFLSGIQTALQERFDIAHSTIQVEIEGDESCLLTSGDCC